MRKKSGIILLLKAFRLLISIFNIYLAATYFSISVERDTWLLAVNAFLILDMALWGPINETFRVKFIFLSQESGEQKALQKARSLLLLTNGITVLLVLLVLWKPEVIATVIAPSYTGEKLDLLLLMIRVIAPTFLFNQVNQLFSGILNAYNSVYIPEIASFISGLINLALIVILAPRIGVFSLVYAYYVALFVLLILLVIEIRRKEIKLFTQLRSIKLADALPFVLFSLPFFVPYFIAQVALLIEKAIASSLGVGVVSSLDYARKFSDIVTGIFLSLLLTIFVPLLSSHFINKNGKAFVFELKQISQLGFLIVTLLVALFTACPDAMVQLLFQSGKIDVAGLTQLSNLAMAYSWCAVAILLYYIFGVALLSAKRQKVYAFYGAAAQLMIIAMNTLLYRKLGVYIFPLSLFLSHSLFAMLMFGKFPFEKKELLFTVLKYLSILCGIAGLMYGFSSSIITTTNPYLVILLNVGLLFTLTLAALFLFKLDEHLVLVRMYRRLRGNSET